MKTHVGPGELQVDFGFFGRNVRFLLIVHVLSGYCAVLVLGPEDPVPHTSICKLLHAMGVGGLDVVCHGDQESLLESVFRNAAQNLTFLARSMHWAPFPVNRPQAKRIVERRIGLAKESFWSIWLGLEVRVGEQLFFGSELFAEAMRRSVRMHNLFHCGKAVTTPMERLRGSTVQPMKAFEFGVVGFGKPQKHYKEHRGKRLVRAISVGPRGANGSGVHVFVPLGETNPRLEVFSSFRASHHALSIVSNEEKWPLGRFLMCHSSELHSQQQSSSGGTAPPDPATPTERAIFYSAIQDIASISLPTLSLLFSEMNPSDRFALVSTLTRSLTNDLCNGDLSWRLMEPGHNVQYASLLREARSSFHYFTDAEGDQGLPVELRPLFMPHSVGVQYSFQARDWGQRMGFSSADSGLTTQVLSVLLHSSQHLSQWTPPLATRRPTQLLQRLLLS